MEIRDQAERTATTTGQQSPGTLSTRARTWLLVWILVFCTQLAVIYVPKPIGLADQGDSRRTLCSIGFRMDRPGEGGECWNDWVVPRAYPATCVDDVPTSWWHRVLGLGAVLSRADDTRPLQLDAVALLNSVLIATAISSMAIFLRSGLAGALLISAGLCALVIDIAFVSYARSWYTEPAGFVGMLAGVTAVVALLAVPCRQFPASGVVLGALSVVLLTFSKVQSVGLASVLVLLIGARLAFCARRRLSVASVVMLVGIYVVSVSVMWSDQPNWMQQANRYNSVFLGVAVHADYAVAALDDLDINPSLAKYRGRGWWSEESASQDPLFWQDYDKTTLVSVAEYYARHPRYLARAVTSAVSASFEARTDYLGNYDIGSGSPARSLACRWCAFSSLLRCLRAWATTVVGFTHVIVAVAALTAIRKRERPSRRLRAQLAAAAGLGIVWYDLVVLPAAVADGTYEQTRHTVLATFAFALCFWALICRAVVDLSESRVGKYFRTDRLKNGRT